MNFESAIIHTPTQTKEEIRRYTAEILKGLRQKSLKANQHTKIPKELQEKPMFFLEAGEGSLDNSFAIMDQNNYDQKVMKNIITCF